MTDNIVTIPSSSDRLALRIRRDLERCTEGHERWIDAAYDLCVDLAEAKRQHPSLIEFGEWCQANGFGEAVLKHQARAAAIAMGNEPDALRACLAATTRSSLREIYRMEFRSFTSPGKTTGVSTRSRRGRASPKTDAVREVVRPLVEQGNPIPLDGLSGELGVSRRTIQQAAAHEQGRLEGRAEAAVTPLDPAEMAPTQKQRFEAALRKARREITAEIKATVTAEIHAEYDIYVKHTKERATRADRIIAGHKGVVSRKVYRQIKACLHPDHCTFKYASEALRIWSGLEDVLVKPEEPVFSGPPLPGSVAELLARKAEATAERKRKRRA